VMSPSMSRTLTKRDLVISLVVVTVWLALGVAVYKYPQSRTLLWLFWISIVGPSIPRFVRTSVGIWIVCQREK
jgi:hypothetical protein